MKLTCGDGFLLKWILQVQEAKFLALDKTCAFYDNSGLDVTEGQSLRC